MENRQLSIATRDRFLYAEDNKKRYKNKKEEAVVKTDDDGHSGQTEDTGRQDDVTPVRTAAVGGVKNFPPTRTTRMVLTEGLRQALFEKWWASLKKREKEGDREFLSRGAFNAGLNQGTECIPDRGFL